MTNRKLIRPELDEPRSRRPRAARAASANPPEQTNAEEFYYLKQMAAKTPMVVVLVNGEELHGWIEWYDKDALKLNRNDGPNLLILSTASATCSRKRSCAGERPRRTED